MRTYLKTSATTGRKLSMAMSAVAILSIVSLSSVVQSTDAKAYACKSYPTQAVGVRKLKFKAKTVSRLGWRNNVKSQFGMPWSVWNIAKAKQIHCVKISAGGTMKWRCLTSAKPCLYVVQ